MIEMHDAPTDAAHDPTGPQRVRAALAEESLEAAGDTAGGGPWRRTLLRSESRGGVGCTANTPWGHSEKHC